MTTTNNNETQMIDALRNIVSLTRRDDGSWYAPDYAPSSSEYDGDTQPGSAWDEECDRLLADIEAALPEGWEADWSDDDMVIRWVGDVTVHLAISAGTESDVSDTEGAMDYDVTLTIGERKVAGAITLWPDKINGGMAPCGAPEDGWISAEIVRELRAMPDSLARKVRASLAALSEGEVD